MCSQCMPYDPGPVLPHECAAQADSLSQYGVGGNGRRFVTAMHAAARGHCSLSLKQVEWDVELRCAVQDRTH